MEKKGVLVVGSSNMDLVVTVKRFPDPGETIFGNRFEMFPGGKGANQAVCAARLGCKTTFIGKMGNDNFNEKLSQTMIESGVDLSNLFIDEKEHTGTALITVEGSGQNQIIVISGSNMKLTPEDIESKSFLFEETSVVLTQLEIPIETVIKTAILAKQNDALFILNPAPAALLPENLFPLIDLITPNENELELLTGIAIRDDNSIEQAAKQLLRKGTKNVIVTLGNRGCMLINGSITKIYPVVKVNVIDSTAAGDAFNGALASSLSEEHSIDKAIEFANKVASVSVTRMGAQSSMPYLNEIKEFYTI
ncbi:MAG: ribokinase [Ignavibacteriaceae bacterium]